MFESRDGVGVVNFILESAISAFFLNDGFSSRSNPGDQVGGPDFGMKILENSGCGFAAPVFNLHEAFVLFKFLFNAPALVVEVFEKMGRELLVVGQAGGEDFDGAVGELNADEPEGARGFTDTVLAATTASAATWVELNDALGEF